MNDETATWRLIYRVDTDAVIILEVFSKKTPATPETVIEAAKARLKRYDAVAKEASDGEDEEG